MSHEHFLTDDPRLTAYALGELSPEETREVERQVADSLAAQAAVREIRELAGVLQAGLQSEPGPALREEQRAAILVAAAGAPANASRSPDFLSGRCHNAAPAQSANASARIENPGYGRETALQSPRRRWAGRLASLATVAAVVLVAFLCVSKPDRDVAISNGLFSRDHVQFFPKPLTPQALSELETFKRHAESRSSDHATTLASTNGTRIVVADEFSQFRSHMGSDFDDAASVRQSKLASTQQSLMGMDRDMGFRTASATEKLAEQLPVDELAREGKKVPSTESLTRIDTAAVGYVDSISFPDVRKWKDVVQRRKPQRKVGGAAKVNETGVLRGLSPHESLPGQTPAPERPRYLYSDASGKQNLAADNSVVLNRLQLKRMELAASDESAAPAKAVLNKPLTDTQWSYELSYQPSSTEAYTPITENHFVAPLSEPLSTFGVDVDTASYSNVRRFLNEGQLPPPDAVRVEELVNYFRYETPAAPVDGRPFAVGVEVAAAPWQPAHRLVRIGLKGREIAADKRPASNLVFLVDVSGSMQSENKLPLAKAGLKLLAGQMTENDRVAIVTYSSIATLRLASTNGTNRQAIVETIDSLQAGGSTNGAGGIQLAYGTAIENFIDGGVNRVILCTDGDFNVGVTGDDELVKMIEERARTKIFFSVFGFGMGNLKDGKLEKLADKGNGHYAYIDGPREAKKAFVDELAGTLVTIAKDVKVQVEFNPTRVAAYRLIGYENRALAAQDFDDDRKDAGDIGAGHSVTALYEVVPAHEAPAAPAAEGLRYQRVGLTATGDVAKELLAVKLRYKEPEADVSSLMEVPVADLESATTGSAPADEPISARHRPSRDFEWSAAVAAFGMVLRDSAYRGQAGFDLVLELAQGAKGDDPTGQRREFIELVNRAKSLRPDLASSAPTPPPSPGAAPPASANRNERDVFKNLNSQQIEELLGGRYKNLLRIIPAESDAEENGNFKNYGYWDGTSYLGHENLPTGYWVYVYPNWYIWGDAADGAAPIPAKRPIPTKPR